MKEMEEMNKAFNDFDKTLVKTIKACQDFRSLDINKTTEPTLETQRDEVAPLPKWGEWVMANFAKSHSWERQVDMNGDVYIREDEDYLDRD